ncbi:hypothetical protein E2C01_042182 [Portunus trituberculatus]|uniref:Uncharacterized protein n=1 Tax=Portunus trituberculatus TaxID=210409 RepID=A0A5B7FLT4_PORTR|nr:hypothetical protein [Portunus trituberculatus]
MKLTTDPTSRRQRQQSFCQIEPTNKSAARDSILNRSREACRGGLLRPRVDKLLGVYGGGMVTGCSRRPLDYSTNEVSHGSHGGLVINAVHDLLLEIGRRAQKAVSQRTVNVNQETIPYYMNRGDIDKKEKSLRGRVRLAWKRLV